MRRSFWLIVLLVIPTMVIAATALATEPLPPAPQEPPPARPLNGRYPQLPYVTAARTGALQAKGVSLSPGSPSPAAILPEGVLLGEGFEDGIMPPPGGWSVVSNNTGSTWTIVDVSASSDAVRTGRYAAWINYDGERASDEWLYTPALDLSGVPDAMLWFWAVSDTNWCPNGGGGATVRLHVTDGSGTSIATLWDMCADENWPDWGYRHVVVDLSAYDGQTIKLAWQYVGIDGQSFGLDDVWVLGSGGTPLVLLEPEYQKRASWGGTTLIYDVTLWNFTDQADSFDLRYSGNAWDVDGPATVGPVANNAGVTFQVHVAIPSDAGCSACDTLLVTAQAQASATLTDSVTLETCLGEQWQTKSNGDAVATHWMAYTCTDEVGAQGTCFYFGGLGTGNTVTAYSQKYDIATDTWTRIADMPVPAFAAVAGYTNGKIYVVGGFTSTDVSPWPVTGALRIYDVATNSWSAGADLPIPRGGAAGGVVNGKLYVAGGQDDLYEYRYLHEYDPAGGSWKEKSAMPDFVTFGAGTGSADRLYVGGGYFGESGFFEYNPTTDEWTEKASLPGGAGKKSPVMVAVPSCGGVFLYGGDLGAWNGYQNSTWYWHPGDDLWMRYGMDLNTPTTGAGGGLAHGQLWSFGGSLGAGPLPSPPHESLVYCCPAAPPTGTISGVVTDANTGQPLANASLYLSKPDDPDFERATWTNTGGAYSFDSLLPAQYELRAAAYGYAGRSVRLDVIGGKDQRQDFALDAALPVLSPVAVGAGAAAGNVVTWTLHLENQGSGELHYHISELPADGIYSFARTMPTGLDPRLSTRLAQAADGTAEFIVYMAEQADLSEAFAIKDRSARGWYVFNALKAAAERSQADLRAQLERKGIPYRSHYIINAISVRGDLTLARSLAARPDVAYVGVNNSFKPPKPVVADGIKPAAPQTVEWNVGRIGADRVWSDFGDDGTGIVVANIDTGVQWDHPALVDHYRGGTGGDHNYNWWDPYNAHPTAPYDFHGHGTHTMGTIVGNDGGTNQIGVAPGATWFACNGFDPSTGFGYEAELLECAEFVLAPWDLNGANPDPDKRADVVNNSWGGGQAQWWYNQIVYAWQAAGIFPVFSAGNDGPGCGTVGDPSDMANALSVGAVDAADSNATSTAASFSSRGPAQITGLTKPNVSAPGANIRSSTPGNTYQSWNGTSMAAPHVAGEVALIWAAQPDLRGNVQLTRQIIERTAKPLTVDQGYYCGSDTATSIPNNQYGWGRIDAYAAVSTAVNANWDIGWLQVISPNGSVPSGGAVDLPLRFDSNGLTGGRCYNGHLKIEYNDPYVVEQSIPVALCVDMCLGLDDLSIGGPSWTFVNHDAAYTAAATPLTATLPITFEWSNGQTGSTATYSWTVTGTHTILVTGTNCSGANIVTHTLEVEVREVYPVYLPIAYKQY